MKDFVSQGTRSTQTMVPSFYLNLELGELQFSYLLFYLFTFFFNELFHTNDAGIVTKAKKNKYCIGMCANEISQLKDIFNSFRNCSECII